MVYRKHSNFFQSKGDELPDRPYSDLDFMSYLGSIITSGVIKKDEELNDFNLYATSGLKLNICKGSAFIGDKYGFFVKFEDNNDGSPYMTIDLTFCMELLTVNNSLVAMVGLMVDRDNREIYISTITGEPSSQPVDPTYPTDIDISNKCFLPLYKTTLTYGQTTISVNNVTDLRTYASSTIKNLVQLRDYSILNTSNTPTLMARGDNQKSINESINDQVNNATTNIAGHTTQIQALQTGKVDSTLVGVANGLATLDAGGKLTISQLPVSVMEFKGTFGSAGSTTGGDLPSTGNNAGDCYTCDTNSYYSTVADLTFNNGDSAMYDGTNWKKKDNTDDVSSVNGYTGAVNLKIEDLSNVPALIPNSFLKTNIYGNGIELSETLTDGQVSTITLYNGNIVAITNEGSYIDLDTSSNTQGDNLQLANISAISAHGAQFLKAGTYLLDYTINVSSSDVINLESFLRIYRDGTLYQTIPTSSSVAISKTETDAYLSGYCYFNVNANDIVVLYMVDGSGSIAAQDAILQVIELLAPITLGGGGEGTVVGPQLAVNNNICVFDGTTGSVIKDSGISIGNSTPSANNLFNSLQISDLLNAKVPTSDIATNPTANKLLKLNADAKLPADITGDAQTLEGKSSADFVNSTDVVTVAEANKILKLDNDAKLPTSITGDADTVDGKHVTDLVLAEDVVTSSAPNKLLKLNGNSKLPASITGDADTIDGYNISVVSGSAGTTNSTIYFIY